MQVAQPHLGGAGMAGKRQELGQQLLFVHFGRSEDGDGLPYVPAGLGMDRSAGLLGLGVEIQHQFEVSQERVDAVHGKLQAAVLDAEARILGHLGLAAGIALRELAHVVGGQGVDHPHVAVEVVLEALHRRHTIFLAVAEDVGHLVLHREVEQIGLFAGGVVQSDARPQQEFVGGAHVVGLLGPDDAGAGQVVEAAGAVLDAAQPHQGVQVAQAAAPFLDVGLEHLGKAALSGEALLAFFQLARKQVALAARGRPRQDTIHEIAVESEIAGDQPLLQERGVGLHVAFGGVEGIIHGAHRLPDGKAQIPEGIEHGLGLGEDLGTGFLGHQDEQVDVRLRAHLATSGAAHGHQRQLTGSGSAVAPRLVVSADQEIHQVRDGLASRSPVRIGSKGKLDAVALFGENTPDGRESLGRIVDQEGGAPQRQHRFVHGVRIHVWPDFRKVRRRSSVSGNSGSCSGTRGPAFPGVPPQGWKRSARRASASQELSGKWS